VKETISVTAESQAGTPRDLAALDRSIRSGLAWTGVGKVFVQGLSWASTILVVRLLTPSDYGIVGMATVFLGILQPLCDFGIAAAVVQNRALTTKQMARLHGFAVLLGLGSVVVTAAASGPIAKFFHDDALITLVPVIGLGFFLGAFRIVPGALLVRDMRFRTLAMTESIEALTVLMVTLAFALLGHGYWSLALGTLAGRAIGSVLLLVVRPLPIAFPLDIGRIAGSLRFGAWVAVSSLAWYAYTAADRVVIGRMTGEAALGAYAVAMTLASLPVEKISQLYQRVAEAAIASVQDDRAAVARYLLRITEGVSALAFPVSVGLALVADLFVSVVLGPVWTAAIVPMRLLALASAIRALDPLLAQVLIVTGHARDNARSMAIAAVVLPAAFLVVAAAGGGLSGVAAVWLIGHPLIVMTRQLWCVLRVADASFADYLRSLWVATSGTAVMAAAVVLTRIALSQHNVAPVIALAVSAATGMVAYAAALLVLHPKRLRGAWAFFRSGGRDATRSAHSDDR
jgi:teichuronic acid exporter